MQSQNWQKSIPNFQKIVFFTNEKHPKRLFTNQVNKEWEWTSYPNVHVCLQGGGNQFTNEVGHEMPTQFRKCPCLRGSKLSQIFVFLICVRYDKSKSIKTSRKVRGRRQESFINLTCRNPKMNALSKKEQPKPLNETAQIFKLIKKTF